MCLGIPMEVIAVDGRMARCSAKGIERDVSLFLLAEGSVEREGKVVHVLVSRLSSCDGALAGLSSKSRDFH